MALPSWQKIFSRFSTSFGGKFSLPLPLVAGLTLILVGAVAWAFFMGYMVGKGQNPETSIQEMTGLSTKAADAQPAVEQGGEAAESVAQSAPVPETGPGAETPAMPAPFVRPQGEETAAWDKTGLVEKKTASAVQTPKRGAVSQQNVSKPAARSNEPQFEYKYQLAAFRSSQDAKNLVARLAKAGIRAQSGQSGKVALVTCVIRGGQAEANDLRKKMASLKLGQPLLLSKKPVSGKGKRK